MPADACIKILQANNIGPIFKWVENFVIFRSTSMSLPLMGQCHYDYDLLLPILWTPWASLGTIYQKRGKTSTHVSNILASAGTCVPGLSHSLRRNRIRSSRNSDISLTHPACLRRNVLPCTGPYSTSVCLSGCPQCPPCVISLPIEISQ